MKQNAEPPETDKKNQPSERESILHVPVRRDQLRDLGLLAKLKDMKIRDYMGIVLDEVITRELPQNMRIPVDAAKPAGKKRA